MWRIVSGLFLGWSLGANDSANIFGTGVTTGIIRYRTAIWLTAVFVILGALMEGAKCMKVVGELSLLVPMDAFFCALAAAITMSALTFLGIPASTSQAIIGAVIGAGIISESADFSKLYKVVSCWVFTPVCGLATGYLMHRVLGFILDRTIKSLTRRSTLYSVGILAAGCYGAYTLGSNNVANVTGVYVGSGILTVDQAVLIGAVSIAAGVLTYSKKVMMTIGKGIVPLDPFSALVVVLAGGLTLHLFTQIGVPVSSSQAVVGAVVGVGFIGGVQTVSFRMVKKISVGWVMTPVSAGFLAYAFIRVFS